MLFLLVKSLTSMVGVDVFMSILQLNIVQTHLICTLLTVDLRTSVEPHVFLLTFPWRPVHFNSDKLFWNLNMFSISQFLPCSISKRMKMNHLLRTRFLSPLDLLIWGLREFSWIWRTIRAKKKQPENATFSSFFPYPTMYLVFDHNQKHVASKARFFIRSNLISKITLTITETHFNYKQNESWNLFWL